jgi:hypothetical protein
MHCVCWHYWQHNNTPLWPCLQAINDGAPVGMDATQYLSRRPEGHNIRSFVLVVPAPWKEPGTDTTMTSSALMACVCHMAECTGNNIERCLSFFIKQLQEVGGLGERAWCSCCWRWCWWLAPGAGVLVLGLGAGAAACGLGLGLHPGQVIVSYPCLLLPPPCRSTTAHRVDGRLRT